MGNQPTTPDKCPNDDTTPSDDSIHTLFNEQVPETTPEAVTSIISNEMMTITRMRRISNEKRDSIHNGVVGVYIPLKSLQVAFTFWNSNISNLNISSRLEIGCSIFFGMVSNDDRIKTLCIQIVGHHKFDALGLKFLDMMGYLIRSLMRNDINLYYTLRLLGLLHTKRGIQSKMYDQMLAAMNDTFHYYFADQYTEQVKLVMTEIFTVVKCIMNDENVVSSIGYLESVDKCLLSLDGRTALLSYLKQCKCNNIVLFYELLNKFKSKRNDMQRFMVARDIVRFQIDGIHGKAKKVNISQEIAQNVLNDMQRLDDLWLSKVPFVVETTFFDDVEREIQELVAQKYWKGFKESILSNV